MLRSAMKKCGITEVKTYNGGRITATNNMTKESAKAQAQPTTQHVRAVYADGHTENIRKCQILKNAIEIKHNENKAAFKANMHKLIDKI